MKAVYDMTQEEFEEHIEKSGFNPYGGKGEIKKLKRYFSGDDLLFSFKTGYCGDRILVVTAFNPHFGKDDDTVYCKMEYSAG